MQFVFQALTWGFLITLVPVVIHLINMLRHKRVKWAAMDFLLKSYKKHRRWVWLKQFLLLLMRMAAIALIVAMLAQWDPGDSLLQALGGQVTHHYVLLDDSYSMGERQGAGSVFDVAKKVVGRIGGEASEHSNQRFTLIRFSRATLPPDSGEVADYTNEIIEKDFGERLEAKTRSMEPSPLAAGPRPALELLQKMLEEGRDQKNVCYIVSDYRAQPWEKPAQVRDLLQKAEELKTKVHLISAARTAQGNLSIEEIRPDGSTRAAGVPLFVEVMIRNNSDTTVSKIEVKASTIAYDADDEKTATPGKLEGIVEQLPAEVIESLEPGALGTARFQIAFPSVGNHVFSATLPDDTVKTDNQRQTVLALERGEPVLAIEDRLEFQNGDYLLKILQPGGQSNTGLQPTVEPSSFLRETSMSDLQRFTAIYLFGADQLEPSVVGKLEEYVASGGGLAIFMSPGVDIDQYNRMLHKEGEGLMPLPLGRRWLLEPPLDEGAPDIDITGTNHVIFSDLLRGRNPIIRMVKVNEYVQPEPGWEVAAENKVDVLARLHNGMPLAAEKRYGNGRVFQFMSSFSPIWNDLVRTPNMLMTLNLQAYLASSRRISDDRNVGNPLRIEFNGDNADSNVRFVVPAKGDSQIVVERKAEKASLDSPLLRASLVSQTEQPGTYEAWTEDLEGNFHVERFALNVDPTEGELRLVDSQAMLNELEPVRPSFQFAEDVYGIVDESGFNPSLWIMGLLILLLLGEQMLAYTLSYHPPATQGGDAR